MKKALILDFNPTPQKRHRHCKWGIYDPSKKEKMILRGLIQDQWESELIRGPVSIDVKFSIEPNKSSSKKERKRLLGTPHWKKKDIDNLLKFLFDSMNGIVFVDDGQVWKLATEKFYGERPRIYMEVIY